MALSGKAPEAVYRKRFHRALGINVTMKCPLTCAHCSVHSGPTRGEKLDRDVIVRALREIGAHGKIRKLSISGGEPFAAREVLQAILQVAAEHHIDALVTTSAYWAVGRQRACHFLAEFPGLTHLLVSADEYHEPFVPLAYVKNALLAALRCNIVPELAIRVWDVQADPFLERLTAALGVDLLEQVGIDLERIQPVGRGADLPLPPMAQRPMVSALPAGACDVAHQPIVDTDGTVLACCNQDLARKNPPLRLGNLASDSFVTITQAAEQNPLLHALRLWGPRRLADMVREHGMGGKLKGTYPQGDICALCDDLLSQPDLVAVLQRALDTPEVRAEIALGRLLRFGETAPLEREAATHLDSWEEAAPRATVAGVARRP